MSAENANAQRHEAPGQGAEPQEAREAASEQHREEAAMEPTWQVGQEVSTFHEYGKDEKHTAGKVESIEDGIYTIDVGGEKVARTEEGLRQDELKNSLHDYALIAANEVEGVSQEKIAMIQDGLTLLVDELVLGGESESVVQGEVTAVMREMLSRPEGEENAPAWMKIKEHFSAREAAIEEDLKGLDYEDEDVSDFLLQMSEGADMLADAQIAGDDAAAAEHGAELFETVSEVAQQLHEELGDAPGPAKMGLSNALGRFISPLSLGARGVKKTDADLSMSMSDIALSFASRMAGRINIDKVKAEVISVSNRIRNELNAQIADIRERVRDVQRPDEFAGEFAAGDDEGEGDVSLDARARPVEDAGVIMPNADGEAVPDMSTTEQPRTARGLRARDAREYSRPGEVTISSAHGPARNMERSRPEAATFSPDQKAEAKQFALSEKGIDASMSTVSDFLNSESGRLAILGDPSLEGLRDFTANDYKAQQDLAVAGGFWARRKARKAVKNMDSLIAKAGLVMADAVGKAPIGGYEAAGPVGAGYSANMGGMPAGGGREPGYRNRDRAKYDKTDLPTGDLLDADQTFADDPTGELLPADPNAGRSKPQRVRSGVGRRAGVSTPSAGYGVNMGGMPAGGGREPSYRDRVRPQGKEINGGKLFDADQEFADGEQEEDESTGELLEATDKPAPTHRARPGKGRRESIKNVGAGYGVDVGGVQNPSGLPSRSLGDVSRPKKGAPKRRNARPAAAKPAAAPRRAPISGPVGSSSRPGEGLKPRRRTRRRPPASPGGQPRAGV
ncbi:hypothetical protein HOI83_04515 [Candidatus Uhrbacteria bacterium]|nr:hypothetical protein [Candidatus Uhrbacteria bacterium]